MLFLLWIFVFGVIVVQSLNSLFDFECAQNTPPAECIQFEICSRSASTGLEECVDLAIDVLDAADWIPNLAGSTLKLMKDVEVRGSQPKKEKMVKKKKKKGGKGTWEGFDDSFWMTFAEEFVHTIRSALTSRTDDPSKEQMDPKGLWDRLREALNAENIATVLKSRQFQTVMATMVVPLIATHLSPVLGPVLSNYITPQMLSTLQKSSTAMFNVLFKGWL